MRLIFARSRAGRFALSSGGQVLGLSGRTRLGRVLREIRRYPVKSMLGEAITTAGITERGIAGDRVWAVVDEVSGLVASAKHPRTWSGARDRGRAL